MNVLRPTEYAAQPSPVTKAPVAIMGSIGTEATAAIVIPVAARPPTVDTVSGIRIERTELILKATNSYNYHTIIQEF